MTPSLSYRIWHTQRSGSTLLCKALESTGIAGQPGEHLNIAREVSLLDHYQVGSYRELKNRIWQCGTSPNGVFGIKTSMYAFGYNKLFEEIKNHQQITAPSTDIDHEGVWADLFPNCKHLYITRRNKARLAVSWWKAIQDQVWHLENGKNRPQEEAFYDEKYNLDALNHLFKEANLREAALQEYFDRYDIAPLTIVYEDFIKDYESTVFRVLQYLRLDTTSVTVAPMFYRKTADQLSEKWVQRFRQDLQSNMEEKVW